MLEVREVAKDNIVTLLREGDSSLWFDNWSKEGPLMNSSIASGMEVQEMTVREAWDGTGEKLSFHFKNGQDKEFAWLGFNVNERYPFQQGPAKTAGDGAI
ncbi:hypothetical protein ACH5RR_041029 [Cinchona calisaya]|uniref:Uncharacterized protein n=1 Tax=Cinchona calisaya TaxID=153742 RepID=A0ABD2XST4_9GENT